jgi:hypothetical protein
MQSFKSYLPTLWIVLGFLIISVLFCYPAIDGKVLYQHDNISWKSMAHEGMQWHEKTGEQVLWSNSMFGGMPTYTHYIAKSNNHTAFIQTALTSVLSKPIYFFFFAMLCFFILMQTLGINKWLGAIGSIAFAFSAYNPQIIAAGHETKMLSIAYLPLLLSGFLLIYRGTYKWGVPAFLIAMALLFANAHYQIIYYAFILLGLGAVGVFIQAIKEKTIASFIKSSLLMLGLSLVTILPNLGAILATKEYTKVTMRGGESELTSAHDKGKKNGGLDKDYAFMWSNGIGETFCLLIPDLYGGGSEDIGEDSKTHQVLSEMGVPEDAATNFTAHAPTYWGPQPFVAGPIYFGAIICFLFVLGMFLVKSHHKWWLFAAVLVSIVLSWGDHFKSVNYFLFDHLPMLNKFRTPTMTLSIAEILFPLIGIWGLSELLSGKWEEKAAWAKIKLATLITGGIALVVGVGSQFFFDFKSPKDLERFTGMLGDETKAQTLVNALVEDRASLAMHSGMYSLVLILLAAALLWALVHKKINTTIFLVAIAALIAFDEIKVAAKYLNDDNYKEEADYEMELAPREVDAQILKDTDPYYRVLDLTRATFEDAIQSYHHKTVGGYSPAKMEIYQDLINMQLSGNNINSEVLNMLNTKYIIFPGQNNQPMQQRNPNACGNAWFVKEIKWVQTADEEMAALNAASITDPTKQVPNAFVAKQTAVIRQSFQKEMGAAPATVDSTATIRLHQYGLDEISFIYTAAQDGGVAVFSDIYYPLGWKAYIDGKEVPIVKADYVLRALRLPKGTNKIINFKFQPATFEFGNKFALLGSVLFYLLLAASAYFIFKKETPIKN